MKIFKKTISAALSAALVASVAMVPFSVFAADEEPEALIAYLCIQAGGDSQWEPDEMGGITASITGDGQYQSSAVMAQGSESLECLFLETNINAYAYAPEGTSDPIANGRVKVVIDSIVVNQISGSTVTWDYVGPATGAFRVSDDGSSIRFNIWNVWTSPKITDLASSGTAEGASSFIPDGGLAAGDEIVVNFSVTGIDEPELSYGDLDGDGDVTLQDGFSVIQEYSYLAAGRASKFTDAQNIAGDVDGDGTLSLQDGFQIISYYSAIAAGKTPDISDYFTVMK